MEEIDFLGASKDMCELMTKQINTDDRIKTNLQALIVIAEAASRISTEMTERTYWYALVKGDDAEPLMVQAIAKIKNALESSRHHAESAIIKASKG